MVTNTKAAGWAVANPTLARGQLLTAARKLGEALHEVDRMVGYLDGHDWQNSAKANPRYLELGMNEVQRHLLHAVRALDMGNQ